MIDSRKLEDLHPAVRLRAEDFIARCAEAGIRLLVTCTLRDHECQDALYAKGRTAPGRRVTNARGGQSFHNYGLALDVVPLVNGKPVWRTTGPDAALWQRVGELGEAAGLEWSGRWKRFKEMAHFQYAAGLTLAQLQAGAQLEAATT